MNTDRREMTLSDVLYAYALAAPQPNAAVLDDFTRRCPEHAAALTDFAVRLALEPARVEPEAIVPDPEVESIVLRAMSRFHNKRYAVRAAVAPVAAPKNPLAHLSRTQFRAIAQDLAMPTLLLAKLRDRRIEPSTVPDSFRRRAARALATDEAVFAAHLYAEPEIHAGIEHKSDQQPQAGSRRQTFEEAARSSGMSEVEIRRLLSE